MSMEQFILSSLENIGQTNFDMIIKGIGLIFVLFWLLVVYWVAVDSAERSRNILFRIISSLMVLIFNVPGLIMYFLIRPRATEDEMYWANLERKYLKFETMDIGECPKCNSLYTPNYLMCPICGYELRIKCANCGLYNEKNWRFCPYCMERNQNSINEFVVKPAIVKSPRFKNFLSALKARVSSISIRKSKVQIENSSDVKTVVKTPKKNLILKVIEKIESIRNNWKEKRRIQKELKIDKAKMKELTKKENDMIKANEKLRKAAEKLVVEESTVIKKAVKNNKKKNKNKKK